MESARANRSPDRPTARQVVFPHHLTPSSSSSNGTRLNRPSAKNKTPDLSILIGNKCGSTKPTKATPPITLNNSSRLFLAFTTTTAGTASRRYITGVCIVLAEPGLSNHRGLPPVTGKPSHSTAGPSNNESLPSVKEFTGPKNGSPEFSIGTYWQNESNLGECHDLRETIQQPTCSSCSLRAIQVAPSWPAPLWVTSLIHSPLTRETLESLGVHIARTNAESFHIAQTLLILGRVNFETTQGRIQLDWRPPTNGSADTATITPNCWPMNHRCSECHGTPGVPGHGARSGRCTTRSERDRCLPQRPVSSSRRAANRLERHVRTNARGTNRCDDV